MGHLCSLKHPHPSVKSFPPILVSGKLLLPGSPAKTLDLILDLSLSLLYSTQEAATNPVSFTL